MTLLHISDVVDGKILYVMVEENEINPYFYNESFAEMLRELELYNSKGTLADSV